MQTIDNSQLRVNDSLRITVNNDQFQRIQEPSSNVQFHSEQGYKPALSGLVQERSASSGHFRETLPTSQYGETYKEPLPVPPVKEIVQQTGHLLSQIDTWDPVLLQPRHDSAASASQSAVSKPSLVNISNSSYASLNASSSLAQNLLKNINLLGQAFSSSSVTYNPTDSTAATLPVSSASYTANYGDRMSGSSSHALPVISSKQEGTLGGGRLSLKYRQSQTSSAGDQTAVTTTTSSTCDPIIATVLKSIGFNFDLSKFGSPAVSKQPEQTRAKLVHHSSISNVSPQSVVPPTRNDPVQSNQNLTTPLNSSSVTAYDKISEMKTFSEIDKVLQKVREHSKGKLRSRSPVMPRVRSRSSGRSSSSSLSTVDNMSPIRKPLRLTNKEDKKRKSERREHVSEVHERHSRRELRRQRASPSPRRHASPLPRRRASPSPRRRASPSPRLRRSPSPRRRGTRTSRKKARSSRSSSSSSLRRFKSNVQEHRLSPKAAVPMSYPTYSYPYHSLGPPIPPVPPLMSYALPSTSNWETSTFGQKKPEDTEWQKSTEEFLRKLHEPSRPFAAAVGPCYSPAKSDLSSVSSGSVGDYVGDKASCSGTSFTSPQKTTILPTVAPPVPPLVSVASKIPSLMSTAVPGTINRESSRKMKKVCGLWSFLIDVS